jgi:hypothetical protein
MLCVHDPKECDIYIDKRFLPFALRFGKL